MSRFYPQEVPQIGELVFVTIDVQEEHGFLCTLLEYGEIKGYLPMTELSRKRIRSIHAHAKIGQQAFLQVIRVEGTYVDLSKKFVGSAERTICNDKYQKGKNVHGIFNHLAEVLEVNEGEIQSRLAWPLYANYDYAVQNLFDKDHDSDEEVILLAKTHPFWILKQFALNGEEIFEARLVPISEVEKAELKKILLHRIKEQQIHCQALVELTCYTFEGIDGIKRAAGYLKKECPEVQLKYKAAPDYCLMITTTEEIEGETLIKKAVGILTEAIEKEGGNCALKEKIQFFTD